ncbi:hypothetical protein NEPAR04_0751 [Nematocida parisii]|nr:hypothetical protein NEPAR08_0752 [Nematocida parisii]KAI5127627.1 hypothetical protein NEPAR03_1017 [Nematocida parisii]KAI5141180.1 hypothetical protein NEPAR04_0751 [Nematocida parisii]
MDFNRESEVRELERRFNDSIELCDNSSKDRKKARDAHPFRVKYESSRDEKIHNVEQELFRLKEMQSRVLGIQETIEETIEKEVKKSKEKEIKELKNKYKTRLLEIEALYKEKEKEIKRDYEQKMEKIIQKLKEKAKETIKLKVAEEVQELKKHLEKRVLEVKLRDKAVIDKLSQMYIDLKEKYKRDVQKIHNTDA